MPQKQTTIMTMFRYVSVTLLVRAAVLVEGNDECGLYLAETVDDQGVLTMGVFSSIERPAGSLVGYPDVVLPLVDIPIHNSPTHEDIAEFWWLFDDFVWDANEVGGMQEGADVKSVALGLGSLTRGSPQQRNVFLLQSHYDMANLHRANDPGAGAISYYPGAALVATHDISAGDELFFHHNSYHWYLDPKEHEKATFHALPADNPKGKDFWRRYQELHQKHTSDVRARLWGLLQDTRLDSAMRSFFPASWRAKESTETTTLKGGKRSPEWLRNHGLCMDNLIQDISNINQAGRGAFATRTIEKGALIAPAPLVHIADKATLNMYRPHVDENFQYVVSNEVVGQQLLLNYCFGHRESTKLLCPIGSSTSFINHSPTPNAALRWSTHHSHQKDWLNLTVDELGSMPGVGLLLEYYALREIQEDEEITIDYGQDWETAWQRHMERWVKPVGAEKYQSAADLNADDPFIIKTVEEQKRDPYPHTVVTSCYYEYVQDASYEVDESGTYADPQQQTVWVKNFVGLDVSVPDYLFVRPCRILERTSDNLYTVQILNYDHQHRDQIIPDTYMLIVRNMPRDAITFTDFAYTTDQHLPQAFRHEMMLPDFLFPDAWRNLRWQSSATDKTDDDAKH